MQNPYRYLPQLLLCCTSLVLGAAAQSAADTLPSPPPPKTSDATVTLDPFEVSSTSDKSYGEINSNSITAFNTRLDKMPVSADVFDQAMLNDTGLTTVEQVLGSFSAGAGLAQTQPDVSAANSQYLDRNTGTLSLRGLQAPSVMLNGFFPTGGGGTTGAGVTSTFNIEKIEVINGPQALLYGVSGAGGVINLTFKQARLDAPAAGSVKFQMDEYGDKLGQLDYGVGTDRVAVRVAAIEQSLGSQRLFYGGPIIGRYVQIAVKPIANTTIRVTYDQESFNRINGYGSGSLALTALTTSNDARNGQYLNWLIATNQTGTSNSGNSGAGALPGVDWNTASSFAGVYSGEYRDHHLYLATADTRWASWLTTQVAAGYRTDTDFKIGNGGISYDAPNVAANPTGTFAVGLGSSAGSGLWEPSRQKVARASLLADNLLFSGRVHSQTIVGVDTTRTDAATITYYYVMADSNWNPIYSTSVTANGFQIMPTQYWSVANGPVRQALYNPESPKITLNGTNYIRAITNQTNPALISPTNQEGLTGSGSGDFRHTADVESGIYAANYSDFFNGNLTTLAGLRIGKVYDRADNESSNAATPSLIYETQAKFTAFTSGVNFKVVGGLRAYAEFSDNFDPPGNSAVDPYGVAMKVAHGLGEEVGLKETAERWNLSGSLAVYHASSTNETLAFTSTITHDINPSGLNGVYNSGSNLVNVNRETQGLQATVTAAPGNWRLRLSAATVKSTIENAVSYAQLYNDQFHTDSSGDVTYADGTIVYVAPTYNSKGVIAAPASSAPAGYVPLTLATINNPSSNYYANPAAVSSAITGTDLVNVLRQADPVHGLILTGKTGLPISQLQVAPNTVSPPPGTIVITQPGDAVSGFPRVSLNFIGVYTVPAGLLKGVMIGGTATIGWKNSLYYYYPLGVSNVDSSRIMLYEPTETVFMGILGYQHKFRRVTFQTQININNLLNHYDVILLPSYVNGWAGPNNATLDQSPRSLLWSTTLSF